VTLTFCDLRRYLRDNLFILLRDSFAGMRYNGTAMVRFLGRTQKAALACGSMVLSLVGYFHPAGRK
jgi:hypothetical protein